MKTRAAVVSGVGVISALGGSARETWDALVAGRTGIGPLTLFDASRERTRTAAQITCTGWEGEDARRSKGRLSRGDRLGLEAARQALADAGLTAPHVPTRRAGLVLGAGGSGLLQGEAYLAALQAGDRPRPSSAVGFFMGMTADTIAARHGLGGRVQTIMNACSSSTIAIGLAASWVASGEQDLVLAGGVETLSRTTYSGFNALRLVDPERCRPFDRGRSGLSLGECAALLVIEPLDGARRRGVLPYGEIAGCGMTADAHHATAPDPDGAGLVRSMRAALRSCGLGAESVDHVNAHGTGTEQNDAAETRALKTMFGARAPRIPIVSIKGAVGHCLGAAGGIEAFASLMTLRHGVVPPTAGLRETGPDCDLDYVRGEARRLEARVVLSNSSAFGGNNGTLVLKRIEA